MKQTNVFQRWILLGLLVCVCLAGQRCVADSPTPEVTDDVRALKRLRHRSPDDHCQFDVEAMLGFLDDSSGVIHFQRYGIPFVGELEFTPTKELLELQPGAEIRVRGVTNPGRRFLSVEAITVISPQCGIQAKIRAGLSKKDTILPDLYSRVAGTIQQIMRRPKNAFVRLQVNDANIDVIISEPPSVEECLNLIGKEVAIEGTLRRPNEDHFVLMVMRHNQIELLDTAASVSTQADPGKAIQRLNVQVHFSNQKNWLLAQNRTVPSATFKLRSEFAERIHHGDAAIVYCREKQRDYSFTPGLAVKQAVLIDAIGGAPFPEETPIATVASLAAAPAAGRVTMRGVVKSKQFKGRCCEFIIESENQQFLALVTGHQRRSCDGIERGDIVAASGVPLMRHLADGEGTRSVSRSDSELVLFVGSFADIAVEGKPLRVSHELLNGLLLALAVFVGAAFLWVRSLRHQVGVRTENLNAVTSHLAISFEAAKGAVLLNDQHGMVSRVNDCFASMFHFSPQEGTSVEACLKQANTQFTQDDLFDAFWTDMLGGHQRARTVELSMNDRTLTVYGSPIIDSGGVQRGNFWSFEDITESRRLEQEFLHSQKMEAIGQLSGGLAHDFNNLLTVIGMNLSLLEMKSQNNTEDSAEYIEPIQTAVSRAAELTQQLLGFSRKSHLSIQHVDANTLVESVYRMAGRVLDSTIDVSLCLHREPLIIEADITRMEQVLLNFCINARDAINHGHGSICLRTRLTTHPVLGAAVCIEVEDDGQGMVPEVKERIFEPFFTTKQPGEGTGLGLSTAIGVVKQLGGEIQCDSTWESGTTFRIYFAHSSNAESSLSGPAECLSAATGPLRLLLVDDEEPLRLSGRRLLEALGHTVQTACNGREAIEAIEVDGGFDAVLLDLTMPEMTGHEAYEIIRDRWPHLAVAICSGYSADHIAGAAFEQSTVAFLPKPFRVSDLAKTLSMLTKQTL